jgi:hypothetical protein
MLIRFAANTQTGNLSNAAENNYATKNFNLKRRKVALVEASSFFSNCARGGFLNSTDIFDHIDALTFFPFCETLGTGLYKNNEYEK